MAQYTLKRSAASKFKSGKVRHSSSGTTPTWIVPLESRVDYMRLHSGNTFSIPFDELIIFATNLTPSKLMDPAFLRRIPYEIETLGPSISDFRIIFERVSRERGLALQEDTLSFVVNELTETFGFDLAAYQPRFISDHVING